MTVERVKSGAERKFIRKHPITVQDHPAGNNDGTEDLDYELGKRNSDYMVGEDEVVYEWNVHVKGHTEPLNVIGRSKFEAIQEARYDLPIKEHYLIENVERVGESDSDLIVAHIISTIKESRSHSIGK